MWGLENRAPDTSILIFGGNDSASQVLTRGGPNRPLTYHLVCSFWFLVARESMSTWFARVCSASNPADAPSKERDVPAEPAGGKPLPSLSGVLDLFPLVRR